MFIQHIDIHQYIGETDGDDQAGAEGGHYQAKEAADL